MDYFERVKAAVLNLKTLCFIIIFAIFALAVISITKKPFTRPNLYSDSRTVDPSEEVFPKEYKFKPVSDVDYSHFSNQGFASFNLDDTNQVWLNSIQSKSDYAYVHFDGVDFGVNEEGYTDYSLSFYKVSELDESATYEVYVYTASTLSNIEGRLESDQCYWISNNSILNSGEGFRVEILGSDTYIPYTLVELVEYKDGCENIYDRVLISDTGNNVTVYRVLSEEDLLD